jgi:hypothetical protein
MRVRAHTHEANADAAMLSRVWTGQGLPTLEEVEADASTDVIGRSPISGYQHLADTPKHGPDVRF